MASWKENIYFILVGPKEGGNIGASARAIKNMGFKNLSLVNPPPVISEEARQFACNAIDVLESATVHRKLSDALKDKSLVAGTTRRMGKKRGLIFPVEECAKKLFDTACNNKIAILFGREDKGLFNNEVEQCGFLITIPASKEYPTLNLSQSVLLIAHELSKVGSKIRDEEPCKQNLTSNKELFLLYKRISDSLKLLGYTSRASRDLNAKIIRNLKHFIGRAGITEWELQMLHGICTQIEKKLGNEEK